MSQLYVDNIKNRTGGAIGAPSGAVVTGVVTATTFSGNVTGVAATFSGDVNISGTLTYEDVTNIDSTGIITAAQGIRVGAGQSIGSNSGTVYYYGDGSNLDGVVSGVDIESGGSFLGAGVTSINFQSGATVTASGAGTTITISAGITTTQYSPSANAIIQIGLGTAQHHELTLSAGFTTITTSGGSMGDSHSLVLIQPSSGIATVGFSTYFQFPSGATPSMSEGSSKVDLVSFVVKDIAGNTGTGATELLASAGLNYS